MLGRARPACSHPVRTTGARARPEGLACKRPRYDAISAALIGRLARHEHAKGSGVGDLLVADAVTRVLAAAESVAAYAIVVEAKDDCGQKF